MRAAGPEVPAVVLGASWVEDERLARAAWSRLAEAGDAVGGVVGNRLGGRGAIALVLGRGPGPRDLVGSPQQVAQLEAGLARWRVRLATVAPERDVAVLARLGGRLVIPTDAEWPRGLDDLGDAAPPCLWVLGEAGVARACERSVAIVGARACTTYGERVAHDLAAGASERGVVVVSGGAYGIDAAAHRGALAVGGPTVAVLACGVERVYPRGHEQLLEQVRAGGLLVSELPPGSAPGRHRFLERNRLIAALTRATVVVEAAWRSGALSTASRAGALLRPVGVVPGPVTSPASAGCHRLAREGAAMLVTDVEEVLELVEALGTHVPTPRPVPAAVHDGLPPEDLRVLDALPLRAARPLTSLAQAAGLTEEAVHAALGRLSLRDLAVREGGGWRRAPRRRGA